MQTVPPPPQGARLLSPTATSPWKEEATQVRLVSLNSARLYRVDCPQGDPSGSHRLPFCGSRADFHKMARDDSLKDCFEAFGRRERLGEARERSFEEGGGQVGLRCLQGTGDSVLGKSGGAILNSAEGVLGN